MWLNRFVKHEKCVCALHSGRGPAAKMQKDTYEIELKALQDYQRFAALTIQRYYRGYVCRSRLRRQLLEAQQLNEAEARGRLLHVTVHTAACRIQNAWRSHCNKRIYRYYRDLIKFRERADPRDMLRSINPREAQLVDAAAGVHVRLRLGGATFPPLVFYKIFTHRPVTDICAFGPRDYVNEVQAPVSHLHNKQPQQTANNARNASGAAASTSERSQASSNSSRREVEQDFELDAELRQYTKLDGSIGYRSTHGWYRRNDNNGWRPIAERALQGQEASSSSSRQPQLFHHSPLVRREERAQRLRQRKRQWLQKMYQQGMGLAPQQDADAGGDVSDGDDLDALEAGLAAAMEQQGTGSANASSEGPRDLLQWCQHLDFDAYMDDWMATACTLGSEALLPEAEGAWLAQMESGAGANSLGDKHHQGGGVVAGGCKPLSFEQALASTGAWAPFKGGAAPAAGVTSGLAMR